MRARASEVRQKPIAPAHFFPPFVPATGVCLGSFDWLGVLQKNCRGKGTIATFELKNKKQSLSYCRFQPFTRNEHKAKLKTIAQRSSKSKFLFRCISIGADTDLFHILKRLFPLR